MMHQLIEAFLTAHRQASAKGSIVNLCSELDREALALYAKSQQLAKKRLRGKRAGKHSSRILQESLAVLLTHALEQANLCDLNSYTLLSQAVKRWCPWQLAGQKSCLIVQQKLLALLPAARQKQQLQQTCREYREHLKTVMEKHACDDQAQARMIAICGQTKLFGAPPIDKRPQVKPIIDSRPFIDQLAADPAHFKVKRNSSLSSVLDKQRAVNALQATLKNPVKSAFAQIRDFRRIFDIERAVIEKSRDSASMKFIKIVATVLSIGLAYVWGGIWKVKGKTTADNLQQSLQLKVPQTQAL
jgi:hypothetical protein